MTPSDLNFGNVFTSSFQLQDWYSIWWFIALLADNMMVHQRKSIERVINEADIPQPSYSINYNLPGHSSTTEYQLKEPKFYEVQSKSTPEWYPQSNGYVHEHYPQQYGREGWSEYGNSPYIPVRQQQPLSNDTLITYENGTNYLDWNMNTTPGGDSSEYKGISEAQGSSVDGDDEEEDENENFEDGYDSNGDLRTSSLSPTDWAADEASELKSNANGRLKSHRSIHHRHNHHHHLSQRRAANMRERRRMQSINHAFEG